MVNGTTTLTHTEHNIHTFLVSHPFTTNHLDRLLENSLVFKIELMISAQYVPNTALLCEVSLRKCPPSLLSSDERLETPAGKRMDSGREVEIKSLKKLVILFSVRLKHCINVLTIIVTFIYWVYSIYFHIGKSRPKLDQRQLQIYIVRNFI